MDAFPRIRPDGVRYVKLGTGGFWEEECREQGILRLGFETATSESLELAGAKRWADLAASWRMAKSASVSTRFANEVRHFYEAGPNDLWITFFGEFLHWGFLQPGIPEIHPDGDGTFRRINGGWRCIDREGNNLRKSNLPGAINMLTAFRGTTCSVSAREHLIRRINADLSPDVAKAGECRRALTQAMVPLIRTLREDDFELLAELIFTGSGWRRTSRTGGTQALKDIELELPTTGERAFVQVKSATGQNEFEAYAAKRQENQFDRMFYVFHTGSVESLDDRVSVIDAEALARMVLDAGLTDWVIGKSS